MSDADARPIVVKVGGSLLRWGGLRVRLAEFLDSDGLVGVPLLLIAGGGPFADAVRELDSAHGLGEEASHRLALRAMDVTAHALATVAGRSRVVETIGEIPAAWSDGLRPILASRRFLEEVDERGSDPLPRSWDTTSDSIAARVAVRLGASRLILLKSEAPSATTRREAVEIGHVDPVFPRACEGIARVESIDLRQTPWSAVRLG